MVIERTFFLRGFFLCLLSKIITIYFAFVSFLIRFEVSNNNKNTLYYD